MSRLPRYDNGLIRDGVEEVAAPVFLLVAPRQVSGHSAIGERFRTGLETIGLAPVVVRRGDLLTVRATPDQRQAKN